MYVNVMIRFCTRSLRYSTEVPVGKAELAPLTKVVVSEYIDCASESLADEGPGLDMDVKGGAGTYAGVPAVANDGSPLDMEMLPPGAEVGPFEGAGEFEVDLKEESRFCAEDFRRIVGRGAPPSTGPPDKAIANAGPVSDDIELLENKFIPKYSGKGPGRRCWTGAGPCNSDHEADS